MLWIDGSAAVLGGVYSLGLRALLAPFYGLPLMLLTIVGAVNLLYACMSLNLARLHTRSATLVALLASANLAWSCVCVALIIRYAATASPFGIAHLAFESAFVATLAALEWRHRHALAR